MEENITLLTKLMATAQEQLRVQGEQLKAHTVQMSEMRKLLDIQRVGVKTETRNEDTLVIENLSRSISTYKESDGNFGDWFKRFEDVFTIDDGSSLDDGGRARLLIRKLDQKVFEKFANRNLPRHQFQRDSKDIAGPI